MWYSLAYASPFSYFIFAVDWQWAFPRLSIVFTILEKYSAKYLEVGTSVQIYAAPIRVTSIQMRHALESYYARISS